MIERLERRQRALNQRREALDRVITALRPLYAAFDETQKRIADDEFFRPNRMQNRFFFRRMPRFGGYGGFDRGYDDGQRRDSDRDSGGNTF